MKESVGSRMVRLCVILKCTRAVECCWNELLGHQPPPTMLSQIYSSLHEAGLYEFACLQNPIQTRIRLYDKVKEVARFDFSWGDLEYHQETLENLRAAVKATKKLCAVMLDTVGAEFQVVNNTEKTLQLQEDGKVILTPDNGQEGSSEILPINFSGLSKVDEVREEDVVCVIKNTATLTGSLFTLHGSQVHIDLPTLSDKDKEVISTWDVKNKIDFLSLSYTRHAEDVRQAREILSKLGDLSQTHIFAKIENEEGLTHFDEILQEADGIILSRGNLGIDLPSEKLIF